MPKVVSSISFMLTILEEPCSRHGKSTNIHIHFDLCFGPYFYPSAPASQYEIDYLYHNCILEVLLFIYVGQDIARARETLTGRG